MLTSAVPLVVYSAFFIHSCEAAHCRHKIKSALIDFFLLSVHPGIITTGSTQREYQYYVSAYQVLYSNDGKQWYIYREANTTQDKVIQSAYRQTMLTQQLHHWILSFFFSL